MYYDLHTGGVKEYGVKAQYKCSGRTVRHSLGVQWWRAGARVSGVRGSMFSSQGLSANG